MSDDLRRRWIRLPGGGELRGEGTWRLVSEADRARWDEYHDTSYLPTAYEVPDHVDIFDRGRPDVRPRFIVSKATEGLETLVDQKHKIAMRVPSPGDEKAQRWAVRQLQSMHEEDG